jgi:regulatory protein YycH of two-component signal transduction system YycFG
MRKSILLILTILLGVSLVFSFGYHSWGSNWNEPSSTEETEINSYSLKITEIDTSRPLAIAEDNNGKEYVINFGILLNKYRTIPVESGQTIQIEGRINQNFFSTDVIFAEKAAIKDETYFIDYNSSNYYGGCDFGSGYNRNRGFGGHYGYGHGMMNW